MKMVIRVKVEKIVEILRGLIGMSHENSVCNCASTPWNTLNLDDWRDNEKKYSRKVRST